MKTADAAKKNRMNQQRFEELFRKYGKLVFLTAKAMTGKKQDALDIQQTVFLNLIEQGETLETKSDPKGYLYRAAYKEALLRFRRQTRRKYTDDDVNLLPDPASDCNAAQQDMTERLLDAMAQLDPDHSQMLVLWAVHGYSDAEIAVTLGKTRGAVAVTMHRARARLKEILGGEAKEGGRQ